MIPSPPPLLLAFSVLITTVAVHLGCDPNQDGGPGPEPGDRIIRVPEDEATIQEGIDAADPGDTVLVAPGIYTSDRDKNVAFRSKDVVLRSEAGAQATVIDCSGAGRGILFEGGETKAAVLAGFTIRAGVAGDSPLDAGGALHCGRSSSPTIAGCRFEDNEANLGGAVFCDSLSAPTFIDCVFSLNSATSGGAIFCNSAAPVLVQCTLNGNSALTLGGGIFAYGYSSPTLTGCLITANTAGQNGGGAYCFGFASFGPTMTNCTLSGNAAITGVGLYLAGSTDAAVTNTIIAFGIGDSAVACAGGDPVVIVLTCCDIFGNTVDWEGCIADQAGVNGNISADPLFCNAENGDYRLVTDSPCAPAQSGTCGLIGALDIAGTGACGSRKP